MNDQNLKLLSYILNCLILLDANASKSFNLYLFIVFINLVYSIIGIKGFLLVEEKLDAQPEVQTIDLEENLVTILKALINYVRVFQRPHLVFL